MLLQVCSGFFVAAVLDALALQDGPLSDVASSLIRVVVQRITEEQAVVRVEDFSGYGLKKHN